MDDAMLAASVKAPGSFGSGGGFFVSFRSYRRAVYEDLSLGFHQKRFVAGKYVVHGAVIGHHGENHIRSRCDFLQGICSDGPEFTCHCLGYGMVMIVDYGNLIADIREAARNVRSHPANPDKSNFGFTHP